MKFEYTIDKEKGRVSVIGTLEPRKGHKTVIRETEVRNFLKSKRIKVRKCIKNNCVIDKFTPSSGEWIFELDKPKKRVVKYKNEKRAPKTETVKSPAETSDSTTKTRRRKKANPAASEEEKDSTHIV